jgi:hypothetical protein
MRQRWPVEANEVFVVAAADLRAAATGGRNLLSMDELQLATR